MFRRHYSDEQLLAHLDGELTGWGRTRMESHLEACWTCRARQAALEKQVHRIASAFEDARFPSDDWAERQIGRFRRWEAQQPPDRLLRPARFSNRWFIAAPTALAAAAFAGWFWSNPAKETRQAHRIVTEARAFESATVSQPVHQRFRVEVIRTGASMSVRHGRVEVWSDPSTGRYAARWEHEGSLAYGAWRQQSGEQFVHGVESGPASRNVRLSRIAASRPEWVELERRLGQWLAGQRWRPVSVGDDVADFISQSGVDLRIEKLQSANVIRITAVRQDGDGTATLVADFASVDSQPKLYQLKWRQGGESAEVRLVAEATEYGSRLLFLPAVFTPDSRYYSPASPAGPIAPLAPVPLKADVSDPLTPAERTDRLIEVQYGMHRIGACMGDPLQVDIRPEGTVLVSGLVDGDVQRQSILDALSGLPYVRFSIRTVTEAVAVSASPEVNPLNFNHDPPSELVPARNALIHDLLVRHFRKTGAESEILGRIARLSNRTTVASAELLSHAWALRRLNEAFPISAAQQLEARSRWLLEDMLQAHLEGMMEQSAIALGELTQVLPAPASGTGETNLSIQDLFQGAERIDRLIRGIFSLTSLPVAEQATAAAQVLEEIASLRSGSLQLRDRLAADFRDAAASAGARALSEAQPKPSEQRIKP
jgi:hypothetical protein